MTIAVILSEAKNLIKYNEITTHSTNTRNDKNLLLTYLPTNLLKRYAFTLAEVLITLGIIGVVAALTMPSLIQKHQDKELIVRTKKVYSDLNNGLLAFQADNESVADNSGLFNTSDSASTVAQNLAKYFNGSKVCANKNQDGCSQYDYDIKYSTKQLNDDNTGKVYGTYSQAYSMIILTNGGIISIATNKTGCEAKEYTGYRTNENGQVIKDADGNPITYTYTSSNCGNIVIDVNGPKLPNQFGRDAYWIWVLQNKLTPSTDKRLGYESISNILSGKDKLEYFNYSKGQVFE